MHAHERPNSDDQMQIATVDQGVTTFTFKQDLPKENFVGQGAELVVFEHWSITRGLVMSG